MSTQADILELLSAYRDGELAGPDRERVEKALASDPELKGRLADLEALSLRLHETLEMRAAEVDLRGFSDRVLSRLPAPHRPGPWERIRELFDVRPMQLAVGMALVLVVAVVSVVALRGGGEAGTGEVVATGPATGPLVGNDGGKAFSRGEEPLVQVLSVDAVDGHDTMILTSSTGALVYVQ